MFTLHRGSQPNHKLIFLSFVAVVLVGLVGGVLYLFLRHSPEAELRGEVFIVTKGAQNFKLGLVEVTAIPEETIQPFIQNKLAAINSEFSYYKSLEQRNEKQVQEAQQAYDALSAEFDRLDAQHETAKAAAEKAQEDTATLTADVSYSSPQEVAAYQNALSRTEKLKRQADQLAAQLELIRSDLDMKRTILANAKSGTANQLKKVIQLLTNEELYKGVPGDGTTAVSDSEGQFLMKLPTNRKYVLAAKAQRRVFDSIEEYYWLVWVSLDGEHANRVMLTNNNLMGTDSSDAVFKTKELIPSGITEN